MKKHIFSLMIAGVIAAFAWMAIARGDTPAQLTVSKPSELSNTFASLAKRLEPSVVTVTSAVEERPSRRGQGFAIPFPFENVPNMPNRPYRGYHKGSGVIVDSHGYIITNHHVIDGAKQIKVKLYDDANEYPAKLIGSDRESDLAVIKVDAPKPLVAAAIGNSDAVEVGEWAIAIGAPFGFEATMTAGIISAKGRDLYDTSHPLPRYLQTDAAINQGNSGGPLLNIRGEVIGINTAMATATGGYDGIGFAIPVNMAVKVYNDIIRTGKVSHGAIGVSFNSLAKPELLKAYGASEGVFVESVTPDGPAAKAGIQAGDIIVAYQGHPVRNGDDLLSRVADAPAGSEATVSILRDGKKTDYRVTLADRAELNTRVRRPGGAGPEVPEESPETSAARARFGMSVENLTARTRGELNFSENSGILVTNVEAGSFAEDIGVLEGDIITALNRHPIQSLDDFKRWQEALRPGDPVAFRVMRRPRRGGADWQVFYLAGTLPNQ